MSERTETTPGKTFQTNTKTPGQKPREQLRENLYRGLLSEIFVLGLLKIGGVRDVYVLSGGPGMCDKV